MMSETAITKIYAKALLEKALQENRLEEIHSDMILFFNTIKSSRPLENAIISPVITHYSKIRIFESIFKTKMLDLSISFLSLMIRKGRSCHIGPTAKKFIELYNEYKNIVSAEITSAQTLSAETKGKLKEILKKYHNGTVNMETTVNSELIGGFILSIKDKRLDASIKNNIKTLKQSLLK